MCEQFITYINPNFIKLFMFIQLNKNTTILFLLLLYLSFISFSQKGGVLQYPQVQKDQIVSNFTTNTTVFQLNVLLTTESLFITLIDFQEWAIYFNQYRSQDIGRLISKSFNLLEISQRLQCKKSKQNKGVYITEKYEYSQFITDNQKQPCYKVQKNGLIMVYLTKEVKINLKKETKVLQNQLKLQRIRFMTKFQIQRVRNILLVQKNQNTSKQNRDAIKFSKLTVNQKVNITNSKTDTKNVAYKVKPKKVTETVFDLFNDKRKAVDLVYPFPYSTIGVIDIKMANSRGQGTGFLVAPNIVMTAAHNFYDKKSKEQANSLIFWLSVFGIQGRKFEVNKYYFPQRFKDQIRQSFSSDYGILILSEEAGQNYKYLPVDWSGKYNGEIQIAGYPGYVYKQGVEQKVSNQIYVDKGICEKDKDSQGMLRYQVQTSSGQSGSPIIKVINGEFKVIGIHTIGQQSFNQGILLTNEVRIDLNNWLRNQKIQFQFNIEKKDKKLLKDGTEYEGEWVNGLKDGKGIERYPNGDYYEGEFKQNNRHGKGVLYCQCGGKYEGLWQNGRRKNVSYIQKNGQRWQVLYTYKTDGKVIEEWSQNGVSVSKYQGQVSNEKRNGFGVMKWPNGDRYEGDFKDDNAQGNGTYYRNNGDRYEGELKNYKQQGHGTKYYSNGDKHIGEWRDGKKQGFGTYYWLDGRKWEGGWSNDKQNGDGFYIQQNGDKYKQYFSDGVLTISTKSVGKQGSVSNEKRNGFGVMKWPNGDRYEGDFKDDNAQGNGTYYRNNGDRYEGELKNYKQQGHGTKYYSNGDKHIGEWRDGKKQGFGTYYWLDGRKWEGGWSNDKQNGDGFYIQQNGDKYKQYFSDGVLTISRKV